jgi:hypothetical protein
MDNEDAGGSSLAAERVRNALQTVIGRCRDDGGPFTCCLIGTAAACLRGVPLVARDIDLLVRDRADVDTFARALAHYPCLRPPSWLADARQYIAAFAVDGITVEASTVEWPTPSAYLEALGEGPWRFSSEIVVGTVSIRTVAPELRLATELRRDRPDQIGALTAWLGERGYDPELLDHAMAAQGIDEPRKSAVRAALAG